MARRKLRASVGRYLEATAEVQARVALSLHNGSAQRQKRAGESEITGKRPIAISVIRSERKSRNDKSQMGFRLFAGSSPSRLALNRTSESSSERIDPVPESPQPKVIAALGRCATFLRPAAPACPGRAATLLACSSQD